MLIVPVVLYLFCRHCQYLPPSLDLSVFLCYLSISDEVVSGPAPLVSAWRDAWGREITEVETEGKIEKRTLLKKEKKHMLLCSRKLCHEGMHVD